MRTHGTLCPSLTHQTGSSMNDASHCWGPVRLFIQGQRWIFMRHQHARRQALERVIHCSREGPARAWWVVVMYSTSCMIYHTIDHTCGQPLAGCLVPDLAIAKWQALPVMQVAPGNNPVSRCANAFHPPADLAPQRKGRATSLGLSSNRHGRS